MSSKTIQQVGTQKSGYSFTPVRYLGPSCLINVTYSGWLPRQHVKCLSPKTFSQNLYQVQALTPNAEEIVNQNYEQALTETDRLKKLSSLLSEISTLAD